MSFFSSFIVKVLQYQTLLTLRGPERQCRLDSLTGELGFQIPVVSGTSDSLSCILDSSAQDSGFHNSNFPDYGFYKQTFPRFQSPDSFTWGGRVSVLWSCL